MPTILGIGLAAIVVITAIVFLNVHTYQHARRQLQHWADSNTFTLASANLCFFWYGPFFLRSNRGHLVYRITITTPDNHTRHAYARIGTWWLGALGNQVAIAWDDQPGQIEST